MALSKEKASYLLRWLIPIAIAAFIWFLPDKGAGPAFLPYRPTGLPPEGLHMLAIFVGTIGAIIAKPLPMGAVAMVGMTATLLTQVLDTKAAFSGFRNDSVWLVVMAFFISKAIIKSGLGHRMAYVFIRMFGKKTLGLIYALLGVDLMIATSTPSSTARAGGIMTPIVTSVADSYGSRPNDPSRKKIGAYLMSCIFHGDTTAAILFMTAGATKPLARSLAQQQGVEGITWLSWFLAAVVPGLICLITIPLIFMKLCPPTVKETPNAPTWAQEKLHEMGKFTRNELWTVIVFVGALLMWIFGENVGVSSEVTALAAVCMLLITQVLTWGDLTSEKAAWNTLTWFAILIMMAGQLNELGFIPWFSTYVSGKLGGHSWLYVFLALCIIYFYSHYFFASLVAHVTAMYPAFLAVALAAGAPPLYAALGLAFVSNICASTTHFSSGPASIIFGTGYITQNEWWRNNFIMGIFYLFVWLGVGGLWMNFLGYM